MDMKPLEAFENKKTGSLFFATWKTFRKGIRFSADQIGSEPLTLPSEWGVDRKDIRSETMSGSRRGKVVLDWVYSAYEGRGTVSGSAVSFGKSGASRIVAGSADIPITFSYNGEYHSGLFTVFFRGPKTDEKSMQDFLMTYLSGLVFRPGVQTVTGPRYDAWAEGSAEQEERKVAVARVSDVLGALDLLGDDTKLLMRSRAEVSSACTLIDGEAVRYPTNPYLRSAKSFCSDSLERISFREAHPTVDEKKQYLLKLDKVSKTGGPTSSNDSSFRDWVQRVWPEIKTEWRENPWGLK
jgi:hypothetical protein